jgi:amphi-Trp domain-containing protein
MVAMSDSKRDSKQKFSHETKLDGEGLINLLESLLAGIRSGELSLEHGEQALRLRPSDAITVEIQAKHKPGRESLRLDLEWQLEPVEPVLHIGPVPDPAPIEARRRGVVALRQARRSEVEAPPEAGELDLGAEALARLPKERLYALAQAVELDGRSQLHKSALARALSECDLRPHLQPEDLRILAEQP